MIIHNNAADAPATSSSTLEEQHKTLRRLRSEILVRNRPLLQKGPGPIRVMARLVAELEQECRRHNIDEEIIASEIQETTGDLPMILASHYPAKICMAIRPRVRRISGCASR